MKIIKNNKGFTILEVIVAVSILAFIMLLVWTTTSQSIRAKERGEGRSQVYQQSRFAMDKIINDLQMAFLVSDEKLLGQVRGAQAMKVVFKGEEKGKDSEINFATLSHLRLFRDSRESDQAEVGYYIESDPEDHDVLRLMRRESQYIDDKPDEGGISDVLIDGIKNFHLEFYNYEKDEWDSSWDSEGRLHQNKLPQAVKVKMTFPHPDDKDGEIEFLTTVMVPMFNSPIAY